MFSEHSGINFKTNKNNQKKNLKCSKYDSPFKKLIEKGNHKNQKIFG